MNCLSPEIQDVFCDLYRLIFVLTEYENVVSPRFWATMPIQTFFAGYRLCAAPFLPQSTTESEFHHVSQRPRSDFGETVRLSGLVFFHTLLLHSNPHFHMIRHLITRLRSFVERLDLIALWEINPVLTAWTLFVGAHGSRGQPERLFFVKLIRDGANIWGWRDWREVKGHLMQFLWLEKEMEEPCKGIWGEVSTNQH
jgi:hypothetical protein